MKNKKQTDGERLKYLLLKLPKEKPNEIFNDEYKKEVKELIERIKNENRKKDL